MKRDATQVPVDTPTDDAFRHKNLIDALALFLGTVAVVMGFGFVTQHALMSYFADEWIWLRYFFVQGPVGGTVCRFYGHATVLPNLHLLANYNFFDGSPDARAITVASVCVVGTTLLGYLAVKDLSLGRIQKAALLTCFAAFGVTPALNTKLEWSFGLTDSLVTLGAIITAFGLIALTGSETSRRRAVSLGIMLTGTAIATFSFGSGLAVCPAFLLSLLIIRAPLVFTTAYGLGGFFMIFLAMVGLPSCSMGAAEPSFSYNPSLVDKSADVLSALEAAMVTLGNFPMRFLLVGNEIQGHGLLLLCGVVGTVASVMLIGYLLHALFLKRNVQPKTDVVELTLATIALVSLGAALLVGIARTSTFGVEIGLAPRYAALSMPFWACLTALVMRRVLINQAGSTLAMGAAAFAPLVLAVLLVVADVRWIPSRQAAGLLSRYYALSILLDSTPGKEGVKQYMFLRPEMNTSKARLIADRKDAFGTPVAEVILGAQEGRNPTRESNGKSCHGKFVPYPAHNAAPLIAMHGWLVDDEGRVADHVEIFNQQNEFIGAGLPAAGGERWLAEYRRILPWWKKQIFKYIPSFAQTYSLYPGWVGMVRAEPGKSVDAFEADAVFKDGTRCHITPAASPKR